MGPPTNQVREWIIPHLQLSLTTLRDQVGCGAPEINHAAVPKVSPHPAACDQALSSLRSLTAARNQAVSPNCPLRRRTPPMKMRMPRPATVKLRFRAMARQHLMVKRGKDTLKSKTPSLALAMSLVHTRTLTQSLTPGRRSSPSGRSGTNPAPRRACLPRTQVGHLSRKSSQPTKHSVTRPGKELDSWAQISMLGSARRLLKASQAGPPETP